MTTYRKRVSLLETHPSFVDLCKWVLDDLTDIVVICWGNEALDIDFYFYGDSPNKDGAIGWGYEELTIDSPTRLKMESVFDFVSTNWKMFNGQQEQDTQDVQNS